MFIFWVPSNGTPLIGRAVWNLWVVVAWPWANKAFEKATSTTFVTVFRTVTFSVSKVVTPTVVESSEGRVIVFIIVVTV